MQNKLKIIKTMLFALALAGAGLGLASDKAQAADWLSPNWSYRKAITVDNTSNANALANYQVLVTLNAGNFDYAKANADGSDLRFTSSDGLTEISYWIKEWKNTSGDSKIWVKVPVVPALGSTTIYLYYGDALAVTSLSSFDGTMQKLGTDASTAALWHFDEGSGATLTDSSVNGNNGTLNNFAEDGSDWIADSAFSSGGALNFDGVNNYIEIPHNDSLNLSSGNFTIEGWLKTVSMESPLITVMNKYMAKTDTETENGLGLFLYIDD